MNDTYNNVYFNYLRKFNTLRLVTKPESQDLDEIKTAINILLSIYNECYNKEVRNNFSSLIRSYQHLAFSDRFRNSFDIENFFKLKIDPPWLIPRYEAEIPFVDIERLSIEKKTKLCAQRIVPVFENICSLNINKRHESRIPKKENGEVVKQMVATLREKLRGIVQHPNICDASNESGKAFGGFPVQSNAFDIFSVPGDTPKKDLYDEPLLFDLLALWTVINIFTVNFDSNAVGQISKVVNKSWVKEEVIEMYRYQALSKQHLCFIIHIMLCLGFIKSARANNGEFCHYYLADDFTMFLPEDDKLPNFLEEAPEIMERLIGGVENIISKKVAEKVGERTKRDFSVQLLKQHLVEEFDNASINGIDVFCNEFQKVSEMIKNGSNHDNLR